MSEFLIRRGVAGDVAPLNDLYNHYIRETPITFDLEPISLASKRSWFEQFGAEGRHQLFVAERAGRVVGYACTRPFRDKAAYDTTAETSIYLAPGAQGQGLGRQLYARLFSALGGADLHRLVAGITLPNDASLALHERAGFRTVGVFHQVGRKLGRYWDVLWMEREL